MIQVLNVSETSQRIMAINSKINSFNLQLRLAPLYVLVILLFIPSTLFAFDYQLYEKILDKYVYEGRTRDGVTSNVVDYEGLYKESKDSTSNYSKYLEQLSHFNPDKLTDKNNRISFWINAYNIGAIKMILDHYPVDSIRSMKINIFKFPWNKKILNINGKLYSLDAIEYGILIKKIRVVEAHFSIVCASLSCPDISKKVYKGKSLLMQLKRQAKRLLSDSGKGMYIDRAKNKVYLSQIFKFDKENFSKGKEVIIPFILPYIDNEEDRNYLKTKDYKIEFLEYNWKLNSLKDSQ